MIKKGVKGKSKTFLSTVKKSVARNKKLKIPSSSANEKGSERTNIEKILIENFVSLQKVMANLSVSFNELSTKISKLLELFELSAQALAKKDINITKPVDEKKILERLESILDQNKTIARGLTLIHERIGEEASGEVPPTPRPEKAIPTPAPPARPTPLAPSAPKKILPQKEEYQKSPFSTGF